MIILNLRTGSAAKHAGLIHFADIARGLAQLGTHAQAANMADYVVAGKQCGELRCLAHPSSLIYTKL
jgi:hypothetical protein